MSKRHKILITGSGGMLGVDLCRELGGDYEVYGVDIVHRASCIVHRFYKGDITKKRGIEAAIKKIKPKAVIHTAAWTDVDGCELNKKKAYKVNVEGAKYIAFTCKAVDAALIYISTDFVFDGRKKDPYTESDKPHPLSVYAKSKLEGEGAVRKGLKKYFILRTSWLYGTHGKNFVDTIISKAKEGNVLKVVDDQVGSPTYTRDLAEAIHALIDKFFVQRTAYSVQRHDTQYAVRSTLYGIYHISNSGSVSWYEYAKEILRLKRIGAKVIPISSEELARPAKRPAMSVLDNTKFVKFTGYKMRHWKDALKEYLRG